MDRCMVPFQIWPTLFYLRSPKDPSGVRTLKQPARSDRSPGGLGLQR